MRTLSNLKDLTILVWNVEANNRKVEGQQVQTDSKQRCYILIETYSNKDLKYSYHDIFIHKVQGN